MKFSGLHRLTYRRRIVCIKRLFLVCRAIFIDHKEVLRGFLESRRFILLTLLLSFPFLIVVYPYLIIYNLRGGSVYALFSMSFIFSFGAWLDFELYRNNTQCTTFLSHLRALPLTISEKVVIMVFERIVSHPFLSTTLTLCTIATAHMLAAEEVHDSVKYLPVLFVLNYVSGFIAVVFELRNAFPLFMLFLSNILFFLGYPQLALLVLIVISGALYAQREVKWARFSGSTLIVEALVRSRFILIYVSGASYVAVASFAGADLDYNILFIILSLFTAYSISSIHDDFHEKSHALGYVYNVKRCLRLKYYPAVAVSCLPLLVVYSVALLKDESFQKGAVGILILSIVGPLMIGWRSIIFVVLCSLVLYLLAF